MRDNQRPVQSSHREQGKIPTSVHELAYEVYCEVYSPQEALIDMKGRGCRGGFGMIELIAFLYAHSFPKEEWSDRVNETYGGTENI